MLKIFGKWWPFCSKLNMYVISVYLINLSVCQEQRVTIVKELRHFALKCLYELTTSPSLDDWLLFPKHILVCIPRKLNFCLKPRNLYQCRGNVLARDLHVVGIENVIVYSINLMTVLIKLCDHRPRLLSWRHAMETHDDVIKWKHFPRYWPFVRGIHRPPVNSPHKGQWRGALMLSLICAWMNGWVNNREAGD